MVFTEVTILVLSPSTVGSVILNTLSPVDPSSCGGMGDWHIRVGRVHPCPVHMASIARNIGLPGGVCACEERGMGSVDFTRLLAYRVTLIHECKEVC